MQPSIEATGIPQAADVAPGPDETLLDRVVAAVEVSQDALRECEQAVIGGRSKCVERFVLTALCSPDQVTLHRRPAIGRPSARLTSIDGWDAR